MMFNEACSRTFKVTLRVNYGKDRNDPDFALSCPLDHGLVPFYGKKCIETDKYFKYINLI